MNNPFSQPASMTDDEREAVLKAYKKLAKTLDLESVAIEGETAEEVESIHYTKGYEAGIMDEPLDLTKNPAWRAGYRDGQGDRDMSLAYKEEERIRAEEDIREWQDWRDSLD